MKPLRLIFLVAALVCFLVAAAFPNELLKLRLGWLGLALFAFADIVSAFV